MRMMRTIYYNLGRIFEISKREGIPTFRAADRSRPVARDWSVFLLVNLVGFACNYGTYAALIAGVPLVRDFPILGVAAGSLAGMTGNFLLSRRYVFRSRYETAVSVID